MSNSIVDHVGYTNPASLSSMATIHNGTVYVTTVPRLGPNSFELGDVKRQAEVALRNLAEGLESAGSSMADLLHLTIYLTDISDWAAFNECYVAAVPKPYPVRAAIGIKELAIPGMRVELTAVAAQRSSRRPT